MPSRDFFISFAPMYREHPIFKSAVEHYGSEVIAKANITKNIKYAVLGTKAGRNVNGPVADYRSKISDPKLWRYFAFIKSISFRGVVLFPYEDVSIVLF